MFKPADLLTAMGGVIVTEGQAPFYHQKVARLAVRAQIVKPTLYLLPEHLPNACAVGLGGTDTAIAVTSGLLHRLDENQIEAVLAHEVGHLKQGHSIAKTKVAMKAVAFDGAAGMGGAAVLTSNIDFTPDDNDPDDLVSVLLRVAAGVAIAATGGAIASAMMTAEAFRSEYEADALGAELSGKGWALASALQVIEDLSVTGQKEYPSTVSQLFIVSPAYLHFETHPPTSDRVSRLLIAPSKFPPMAEIPTRYCSSCGEKTDADGSYCGWCGVSIDD